MKYKDTKRILDIAGAGIGLVMAMPALLVASAALFVENKGDVFFKQKRIGKDGQAFDIFKFKTMTDKRDENGDLLPDAQRVTPLGKFMRKHGVDEIPQLLNILKGDMSFVGPRPLMPRTLNASQYGHVEWLDKYINQRQAIRPGLVCHYNGENGPDWMNRLSTDAFYTKNSSFINDTIILAKTAIVAIKGRHHTNNKVPATTSLSGFLANLTTENPRYAAANPDMPDFTHVLALPVRNLEKSPKL